MSDTLRVEDLPVRCAEEWRAATRHPFLDAIADGSLPAAAFDAWLAQDYLFVADLLVFQSRLLARTPRAAQAVVASGVVGLEAELSWFEAHAARRGLGLGDSRLEATERYQDLLEALDAAPYAVAIVALWAIERAYHDAWQGARGAPGAFGEFVDHWTVPEFATYVAGLASAANAALSQATPDEQADAVAAFLEVAQREAAFWQMTWLGVDA